MSKWLEVCQLEQVLPDSGVCALVNEKQVAIFRLGESEELYAIDNYDPFSKANVLSRGLLGDIKGEIVVAAPVYKQHFVLSTGKCLEDESVQLGTYPVKVENGAIQVQI
ncbi:MAG: nitrite reductase small subunit NirD [Pseudomonadales bacterium]|nr:nitrite reductase small subunit NirD [Pseudomonadales bacterium]